MKGLAFNDAFSDNFALHRHIITDTSDQEDDESPLPECRSSSQRKKSVNSFKGPSRPLLGCCMATRKSEVQNGRVAVNKQLVVNVNTIASFRGRRSNGLNIQRNNLLPFPVSRTPAPHLQNVTMLFSNPNRLAINLGVSGKSTTKGQKVQCILLVLHSTGSCVSDGANHTSYDNDLDKLVRNMFTSPPTTKWQHLIKMPGPMWGIWIGLGFTIIARDKFTGGHFRGHYK